MPAEMSAKRFRIAFSFAGEKRELVAQVAAILAKKFDEDKILYDKYHEAEFANWKLGLLLQEHYHDHSDLIVVVVCPDYSTKDWCGLEWVAIHGMLMSGKDREIMLCRFEHAKLQGLNENAGFVDLDHKTPEQTATLILERLALNEGKPRNHYTAGTAVGCDRPRTSIPNNLPRLQPFFGREEELKTIREALDPESRTWGALIDGPGGMGKTSLAIRAAYDCPPGQFQRIIFVSVKDRELDDDGVRKLAASSSRVSSRCSMSWPANWGSRTLPRPRRTSASGSCSMRCAPRRRCLSSTTSKPSRRTTATSFSPSSSACRRAARPS
jgi:TIR domain